MTIKITLDAGHGGTDAGASGNGIREKDITLELILAINEKLKNYKGVQTLLTRSTDVFVSLDDRTNMSNKFGADVFLSCHINAATDVSARGWQSHIYNGVNDSKTTAYQNVIHGEVINSIKDFSGVVDRGKEKNNFAVLRQTTCPAILTENLFITNASDSALLKRNDFIQAVADGHVTGLEKFLGLEKNIPPPSEVPNSGVLYQVVAGTFSQLENAQALSKKLNALGYETQITKK